VASDGPLATLLGDAENPAHIEWQKNSLKFKGKYTNGPSTLDFVKSSLRELALFVTRPRKGIDKDLLKDFFFLEVPLDHADGSPSPPSVEKLGDELTPPAGAGTDSEHDALRITRARDGFRLTYSPDARRTLPASIAVELAYGVRRGNAFSRYHQLDFEADKPPITIQEREVIVHRAEGNRIDFTPLGQTFELGVSGFDPSRDLIVRASEQEVGND